MSKLAFRPKYEKIVEALLYIAHKRANADHYQAIKFLYLADSRHLNRYGRPITSEKYHALKYGPVASTALDLLKQSQVAFRKCEITELPFVLEKLDKIIYLREPNRSVNYEVFSKSDIKVLDEIIVEYGNKSFGELVEITHSHFAWRNVWRPEEGRSFSMNYEDMIEEGARKAAFIEDFSPIAAHLSC